MRSTPLRLSAGAFVAIALLAGCAPADTPEPPAGPDQSTGPVMLSPTADELGGLVADGTLPAAFPADAEQVRVLTLGDRVAASWQGAPLATDCVASDQQVASYAIPLLLMDVGLEQVEQCGDVWQAEQADGSRVLWNSAD